MQAHQQNPETWNNAQGGQQQAQGQQGQGDEIKTLWIGDLVYWMDENYLWTLFSTTGEVASVKVIRNKLTGQSDGYGFVEFVTRSAAERFLIGYNGQPMPQSDTNFRLNWASFGLSERRQDTGPDHSIFVGDLASDVNDYILLETFKTRYQSVKGAKVVTDVATLRSKGYGFVRFGSEEERDRALAEMNGEYCSSRPMRISLATPRRAPVTTPVTRAPTLGGLPGYPAATLQDGSEANNTTIFVGGLDPSTEEDVLRQTFSTFGELTYVKIPYGKGCGFVQFLHRAQAEEAIKALHGTVIGQQAVRLSWGRSPPPKQRVAVAGWGSDPASLAAAASWASQQPGAVQAQQGYYGYGVYDQYGAYAAGAQDPNTAAYYSGYYPQSAAAPYSQQGQGGYQYAGNGGYYQGSNPLGAETRETFDPNAPPNVSKMNEVYISQSDPGRAAHIWLKQSDQIGA